MKKLLSLLMAVLMALTVISATPTVFAEETQYTPVEYEFEYAHWGSTYSSEIVKVGDWYYEVYESYTGQKRVTSVCGYDGDETEITIPTELDETPIIRMSRFCLFSTTVKTIKIPRGVVAFEAAYDRYQEHSYGACVGIRCEGDTQLEEIVVENGHTDFWSEDGVLYEGYSLLFYPPAKKDTEFVIPEEVNTIEHGAMYNQPYLKSLTISKDVVCIYDDAIPETLENLYYYNINNMFSHTKNEIGIPYGEYYYVPKVPNGTIYCIENTEAFSYYNEKYTDERYYKNLEVLKDELIKKQDGKWYYYRGGIVDVNALADTNYVNKTLVKYSGKWFYLEDGIWTKKDTLCEYNSKWFYIDNGKWGKTTEDLVWYKNKWFYVKNGKWDSTDRTLFKKNGKWFAVKSGKWYKDKAIIKYSGKKFYVNNGFVQFDYSGKVKVDGKTYKIKNGKVA